MTGVKTKAEDLDCVGDWNLDEIEWDGEKEFKVFSFGRRDLESEMRKPFRDNQTRMDLIVLTRILWAWDWLFYLDMDTKVVSNKD